MNHNNARPNQPLRNLQSVTITNPLAADLAKEDAEDLQAFEDRADEPVMIFAALLKELRSHGKLAL